MVKIPFITCPTLRSSTGVALLIIDTADFRLDNNRQRTSTGGAVLKDTTHLRPDKSAQDFNRWESPVRYSTKCNGVTGHVAEQQLGVKEPVCFPAQLLLDLEPSHAKVSSHVVLAVGYVPRLTPKQQQRPLL
jgi:hypothetical protein